MRAATAVELDRHRKSAYSVPIPKKTSHGIPIILVWATAKRREERTIAIASRSLRALRIFARRRRKVVFSEVEFCREGKFPASLRDTPRNLRRQYIRQTFSRDFEIVFAAFSRVLRVLSTSFVLQGLKVFRVSCSLTAEAGRISRGSLAPQRSAPAQFFSRSLFSVFSSCSIPAFDSLLTPDFIAQSFAAPVTSAPPVLAGRRFSPCI